MKYIFIFIVLLIMVSLPIMFMGKPKILPGPEEAAFNGIIAVLTAAVGAYTLKRLKEEEDGEKE